MAGGGKSVPSASGSPSAQGRGAARGRRRLPRAAPPPPPPLSRVLLLLLLLPGSGGGAGRRGGAHLRAPLRARAARRPRSPRVVTCRGRAAPQPPKPPGQCPGPRSAAGRGGAPPPPGPERQPPSVPAWRGQERAGRSERPAAAKSPAAPSFLKRDVSNAALNQRALQLKLHCLKHNSSGLRGLHASV